MARIAITGSCGLIGGLVYSALSGRGDEVVGIDRPHEDRLERGRNVGDEGAFARLDHACDLSCVELDDLTGWLEGCDMVVHLAADADPSNWQRSMLEVNIGGTHAVLEAACRAGIERIILASSGLAQVTLESRLVDAPLGTLIGIADGVGIDSPYGLSKIVGESLGRIYAAKRGIEVVSVRIGTVIADDAEHIRRGGRLMATAFLQEDVKRFFLAAIDADLLACDGYLLTAAQSNSPTRFIDLEPGLSSLGWTPVEWPPTDMSEA